MDHEQKNTITDEVNRLLEAAAALRMYALAAGNGQFEATSETLEAALLFVADAVDESARTIDKLI